MKILLTIILTMLTGFVHAVQNSDLIKSGKLYHSTVNIGFTGGSFNMNCIGYRHMILTGDYSSTATILYIPGGYCIEGTRFEIHHNGTGGTVPIKNPVDESLLGTMNVGDTYYVYRIANSWRVVAGAAAGGGGSSFDPSLIGSNLVPSTSNTFTVGTSTSQWLSVFANSLQTIGGTGSSGSAAGSSTNRLYIGTREYVAGQVAGTSSIWIKSGDNATNQNTGSVAITTGTNNNTANTSANSGDIIISTGKANTSTGTNTGSVGGVLIAVGGVIQTTANQASVAMNDASNGTIELSNSIGNVLINSKPGLRVSNGALSLQGIVTYGITPTTCPATACTSSFPHVIETLGSTPLITNALCADGVSLCVPEIVIQLDSGFGWNGNATNKFVCIKGIAGGVQGQRLRVTVVNRTYIGSVGTNSTSNRVPSLSVGFASNHSPIVTSSEAGRCAQSGFMRLKLYQATSTGVMQSASTIAPEQVISSTVNVVTATTEPTSIGSTEFVFKTGIDGWTQL